MKIIKINKKTNNKTDKLELVISILCLLNNIHLSKTEVKVLAYYVIYKINEKTDKLLMDSRVVKTLQSLRNIKVRLDKLGFLKRSNDLYKSYEVNLSKDFDAQADETTMLIKIDNT
jgi:hypothetical protein